MIKIEKTEVYGWESAIRGMRNPMNSWDKSDSTFLPVYESPTDYIPEIGDNDHDLMMRLAKAGSVHAKYRRMITVTCDITAPLYWWKEFDTYKVGTVANSCSTMHKIHAKELTLDDFSHEHLEGLYLQHLKNTILMLNDARCEHLEAKKGHTQIDAVDAVVYWWQMIQLLPTSYNQKRTVQMNYEVLVGMYRDRKNHKLDEWVTFCDWICSLPYSEIITG